MSRLLLVLFVFAFVAGMEPPTRAEERIRIAPRPPYGPRIIEVPARSPVTAPVMSAYSNALPADAQALVSQFNQQSGQIQQQAATQISGLRSTLITQLQELQDRYTRNALLDEAVLIRDQLRALRALEPQRAEPAPSIYTLRGQTNRKITYRVTGRKTGYIWGTDIYTDDSELETVAVHAGVLRDGETGNVQVTILDGQASYSAATRNGITSYPYQTFGGSYRVERGNVSAPDVTKPLKVVPTTDSIDGNGTVGEILSFNVTGSTDGYVWGSGTYTDDSSLGTAAVHAGVIEVGKSGVVQIVIVAGQAQYASSTSNNVTTRPYSAWSRSFAFVSGPK